MSLVAEPALSATDAALDRRARFLQIVSEGLGTHLADNVDYLFEPWGRELPTLDGVGQRLAAALVVLEAADVLWDGLGDDESRALFLRFLAYRALGPAHIRLQLDPVSYRRSVIGLTATAMRKAMAGELPGMPFEWQLHHYDLRACGLPIALIGPPLPIASTMLFSQYAYRDTACAAGPRPGDTALDVGGCWGETALWLAHVVGPRGMVHCFEPVPGNRQVLDANRRLNPELAPRIFVWEQPLGPRAGETVFMPDVIAAGASLSTAPSGDLPSIELETQSVDALVAAYRIPHVDFIKVDVEGADLGVLEGAARTIAEQRPRLAIACYHKPDDLVAIPDFIASLGVEYRWYLQCSTMTDVDTVAFAVPVD